MHTAMALKESSRDLVEGTRRSNWSDPDIWIAACEED